MLATRAGGDAWIQENQGCGNSPAETALKPQSQMGRRERKTYLLTGGQVGCHLGYLVLRYYQCFAPATTDADFPLSNTVAGGGITCDKDISSRCFACMFNEGNTRAEGAAYGLGQILPASPHEIPGQISGELGTISRMLRRRCHGCFRWVCLLRKAFWSFSGLSLMLPTCRLCTMLRKTYASPNT